MYEPAPNKTLHLTGNSVAFFEKRCSAMLAAGDLCVGCPENIQGRSLMLNKSKGLSKK